LRFGPVAVLFRRPPPALAAKPMTDVLPDPKPTGEGDGAAVRGARLPDHELLRPGD